MVGWLTDGPNQPTNPFPSVVSSRYEKSLPQAIKHVVTGDIVRMLLIQVGGDLLISPRRFQHQLCRSLLPYSFAS